MDKAVENIYIEEYYLALKKGINPTICKNVDGPEGYDTKWNKSVRETIWVHSNIVLKTKQMKKQTKSQIRSINTENPLVIARRKGVGDEQAG